jgi:hypothetical protein
MSRARVSDNTISKRSTSGFAFLLLLAACAAPAPPAPQGTPEPPYELVINEAVDSALDDLLIQMQRLPAFTPRSKSGVEEAVSPVGKKEEVPASRIVIAVDRSVGKTKQYSVASEVLDSVLLQSAGQKFATMEVVAGSPPVLNRVQYLLAGTLTPLDAASTSRGTFRINLSLTEFKTSHIVAQCSVRFQAQGVDLRPTGSGITH